MEPRLIKAGEQLLEALQRDSGADLVTCHFLNPHSGHYWLFHKCGGFAHPHLMNGPLTHPDQWARFEYGSKEPQGLSPDFVGEDKGISFFSPIPIPLARQVLAGEPFVSREGVRHSIRVHLGDWDAEGQSPQVFIFLSYRTEANPDFPAISEVIHRYQSQLGAILIPLAGQPRLDEDMAWKLRSLLLRFRTKMTDRLLTHGARLTADKLQHYQEIVFQAWDLIKPTNGKNRLCVLALVSPDNQLNTAAKMPEDLAIPSEVGIVAHVARTGQLIHITDMEAYKETRSARLQQGLSVLSMPEYVECDPEVRCELACPLIVQGRVVGVINIEADAVDSFDAGHVLAVVQLASAAATAVRNLSLDHDVHVAIEHLHTLLKCGSKEAILEATAAAAGKLGYDHPAVWDFDAGGQWRKAPGDPSHPGRPRVDGFTQWIRENGLAVALADVIKAADPDGLTCTVHVGELNPDSHMFAGWRDARQNSLPTHASKDLLNVFVGGRTVVTDLGFPVMETNADGTPLVHAVLWAKCGRFFRSVLDDDCWCLSLLCRNANRTLKVWQERYERHTETRQTLIEYHFGPVRGPSVIAMLERSPSSLAAQFTDEVVVLNLDIRGSTDLQKTLTAEKGSGHYSALIQAYQTAARESVLASGGVMDKTMGDGIQALFHVFRPGALNIDPIDDRGRSICAALDCVRAIERWFKDYLKTQTDLWPCDVPESLCLGAGIACGDGYLGSFIQDLAATGLEYSVHGDCANTAAKLADFARAEVILDALPQQAASMNLGANPSLMILDPQTRAPRQPTKDEHIRLRGELTTPGKSIAILDFECAAEQPSSVGSVYRIVGPRHHRCGMVVL